MICNSRTIKLKDGGECVLRSGTPDDAKTVIDDISLTHEQTYHCNKQICAAVLLRARYQHSSQTVRFLLK